MVRNLPETVVKPSGWAGAGHKGIAGHEHKLRSEHLSFSYLAPGETGIKMGSVARTT
jgi:hypothetical protein